MQGQLSKLRAAWALTNALDKSIKLAKEQTQRDLQQSYLMRAALEAKKLKTLIEELAKGYSEITQPKKSGKPESPPPLCL